MADMMTFPDTVEEFMEQYKITDTDHVYTNGADMVPIFRMKQWFEHQARTQMSSAQPTLYGYQIEHLAYIARVMQKEGVTAEYAVRTFDDMSRVIRMIIEEAQQKVEEALNGRLMQLKRGD